MSREEIDWWNELWVVAVMIVRGYGYICKSGENFIQVLFPTELLSSFEMFTDMRINYCSCLKFKLKKKKSLVLF